MNSTKFQRVWIYGTLTTQNTLHIGRGDVEPFESVEGARCDKLSGTVWLRESLIDWQKGILLLVVRDMLEGELGLGWGKSRGYGSFSVELTVRKQSIKNYSDLKELVHDKMSKRWLPALAEKISLTHSTP